MDFKKETWTIDDIHQLEKYLKANASSPQKISWTKNITRTEKPLFACPNLYKIVRQICKGNYKDFLDNNTFSSWDITQIYGYVLTHEKDFFTLEKYLNKYVENIDSWSNTDLLKFNTKYYESELFELAKKYTKSTKTYAKRTGLKILFSYSNFSKYTSEIFNILNSFYNEKEYYVNMILAWLFCEMFIKNRDATIDYLSHHNLNNFVINKGIQKCRDSYRVSSEDKEFLLKYKVK